MYNKLKQLLMEGMNINTKRFGVLKSHLHSTERKIYNAYGDLDPTKKDDSFYGKDNLKAKFVNLVPGAKSPSNKIHPHNKGVRININNLENKAGRLSKLTARAKSKVPETFNRMMFRASKKYKDHNDFREQKYNTPHKFR